MTSRLVDRALSLLPNRFRRCTITLFALAIQLPLLFLAAQKGIDNFNPDAVAYLRIAKYYAEGRLDLAINGYWGPLLSLIMAPLISLSENPLVGARIVMAFSAVVYLLGSIKLFGALRLGQSEALVAAIIVMLFGVGWSVKAITPDLLMSGFVLMALGFHLTPNIGASKRKFFLSGLLFGSAYLAKAVALPISIGLIVLIAIIRFSLKSMKPRLLVETAVCTFTGFALVALPWIVVLSLHYGTPTFSTSGKINHAYVGPGDPERCRAFPDPLVCSRFHPTFRMFHIPAPGRVTSWEEPSQLPYKYWSPFETREAFIYQIKLIKENAFIVVKLLLDFELLGLGLTSVLAGLFFQTASDPGVLRQTWRLGSLIIVILVGFYLPVYANESRFFLSCYPFMIAASLRFWMNLANPDPTRDSQFGGNRRWVFWRQTLALLIIVGSFLPNIIYECKRALIHGYSNPNYVFARDLAPKLSQSTSGSGAIAFGGSQAGIALYTAFVSEHQFYGGSRQEVAADEIIQSGAEFVVLDSNSRTAFALAENPAFKLLDYRRWASVEIYQRLSPP